MSPGAVTDEPRFDDLRREWDGPPAGQDWESQFSRLTEEWRAVEWRSGGQTLLAALGLQFTEVALCRGLAWLLDPGGGHRMGRQPLHALLRSLDLPVEEDAVVDLSVEETRGVDDA